MKNCLLLTAIALFFLTGCGSCESGECAENFKIQFEFRSQLDSSKLNINVSDIRWQFLPAGQQPDTLFFKDGSAIFLWVFANPNLSGIITQLSSFKPDTILIKSHVEDTPFCPPASMIDSLKLNGQDITFFLPIQLFK